MLNGGSGNTVLCCTCSRKRWSRTLGKLKSLGMFEIQSPEARHVQERLVPTFEHMQVPNGTRPGVRMNKRPLLANLTRWKSSMETSCLRQFCWNFLLRGFLFHPILSLPGYSRQNEPQTFRHLRKGHHRIDIKRKLHFEIKLFHTHGLYLVWYATLHNETI